MRVLLAAMNCPKGDLDGNLARHRAVLDLAAAEQCAIAVFPEFSLTGYDHAAAVGVNDERVRALAASTHRVAAIFGMAERSGDDIFITQVVAARGAIVGSYRKRQLQDEPQFTPGSTANAVFDLHLASRAGGLGGDKVGVIICAEGGVDWTWDDVATAGAQVAFYCSAPGLHGRRTDEASWRDGFTWWEGSGLGDARRHAARLGIWVAMATQAGVTHDEDFPGIAALVDPNGEVVARLPDWREGTLVVDIPVPAPEGM